MAIDSFLSEDEVDEFYEKWVPAMGFSQNSESHPGDERAAVKIVESYLPNSKHVSVKR